MRATLKIASNNALNNILDNYSRVLKVQNQMATGRRVTRPADDPLSANAGMRLDSVISRITQYNRNLGVGTSFLSLSDNALGGVNELLTNARTLTIASASETTTNDMRRTNAVAMNNLLQELVTIANRNEGSRYLFGGTETQRPPYEIVGGRYVYFRGNNEKIYVPSDLASTMPINVTGAEAFGSMETVVTSRDLTPDIQMGVNYSTRLADLDKGNGVPKGSIKIKYGKFDATGKDIDLSGADTLNDVRDIIERETYAASQKLLPTDPEFQTYVKVMMNLNHNGLLLQEWNKATDMPTGNTIEILEVGDNLVAHKLGIYNEGTPSVTVVGSALEPAVTEQTLLADLQGYADSPITITNGAKAGTVYLRELNDTNNYTDNWNLHGLTKGATTDRNDRIYVRMTSQGGGTWKVELFNDRERLPNSRIASGVGSAGTIELKAENNSGVSGTVGINPPVLPAGSSLELDLQAEFDPIFRATISVPAFEESGDLQNQLDGWRLRGLTPEMFLTHNPSTADDMDGLIHVEVASAGGPPPHRIVNLYLRNATTGAFTQIATGTLLGQNRGTVQLRGVAGYESIVGSVELDWKTNEPLPAANPDPNLGSAATTIRPTWATVGDLLQQIEMSNTYTTARIASNKSGIEIVSHLGGAYLTVSEEVKNIPAWNDHSGPAGAPQMSKISLAGVVVGTNTDADGRLYARILHTGGSSARVELYKAPSTGSPPNLVWDPASLVASGTIADVSVSNPIVALQEENHSGLTGSLRLDGNAPDEDIVLALRDVRTTGDTAGPLGRSQLDRLMVQGVKQGVNSDVDGTLYAEISQNALAQWVVTLYADEAYTKPVAQGIADIHGDVIFTALQNSGITGSVRLSMPPTADADIRIFPPRGLRLSGEMREDNIFATFNDIIDSMNANDVESLHNLLGNLQKDLDRLLLARSDAGSRISRMEMLKTRHEDEIINFGKIRSDRIDLDYADAIVRFQTMQNVFEASLRTTGQLIPLSLVDFL